MNLFENEKVITSTEDNAVILTTHRIRSTNSLRWGQETTTSIMLEKVSSIQLNFLSYPMFLVIGGLCAVTAFFMNSQGNSKSLMPYALIIAAIFIIAYFTTRKHVCAISSDGGVKIIFKTERITKDSLLDFVDKVEKAKNNYNRGEFNLQQS